jgi:hypothetical protein
MFTNVSEVHAAAVIALMMETARTSETLVNFYQTTWCYNPEDIYLRTHRRENLKSYKCNVFNEKSGITIVEIKKSSIIFLFSKKKNSLKHNFWGRKTEWGFYKKQKCGGGG